MPPCVAFADVSDGTVSNPDLSCTLSAPPPPESLPPPQPSMLSAAAPTPRLAAPLSTCRRRMRSAVIRAQYLLSLMVAPIEMLSPEPSHERIGIRSDAGATLSHELHEW